MARRTATATKCPDWCAGGHHCTARLGSGEHSSAQEVWQTDIGRMVATRRQRGGTSWLELTMSVRLPEEDGRARLMARNILKAAHTLISRAIKQST